MREVPADGGVGSTLDDDVTLTCSQNQTLDHPFFVECPSIFDLGGWGWFGVEGSDDA